MFHSNEKKIILNFEYDFYDLKRIDENIDILNKRFNVDIRKSGRVSKKEMSDGIFLMISQEYEIFYEQMKDLCNCLIEIGRITN